MTLLDGGLQSGNFLAAAGNEYRLSYPSGDQNQVITLPAPINAFDRIGFLLTGENTANTGSSPWQTHPYFGWEFATGSNINGTSYTAITGLTGYGVNAWGLLLGGDYLELRADGSTWRPRIDARQRLIGKIQETADQTGIPTGDFTKLNLSQVDLNVGGVCEELASQLRVKRSGFYSVPHMGNIQTLTTAYGVILPYIDGGHGGHGSRTNTTGQNFLAGTAPLYSLQANQVVDLRVFHGEPGDAVVDNSATQRTPFLGINEQ